MSSTHHATHQLVLLTVVMLGRVLLEYERTGEGKGGWGVT